MQLNVPTPASALSTMIDRLDHLRAAINTRHERIGLIADNIFGIEPQPTSEPGRGYPPNSSKVEEISSLLDNCFYLLEEIDHQLDRLSRL
jgi:hypothetical protein